MINKNFIPNDKRDAEIYLKGCKQSILDLFATFERHNIETSAHILGTMYSAIEEINELLGVDSVMTEKQYAVEASLDNLTGEHNYV